MMRVISRNRLARSSAAPCDQRSLGYESLEERRLLVVSVSGDPNLDAASLLSYGGPGDPGLPGFDNVGRGSTGGSSVIYLGGGWVLTANHVTIANPPGVSPGGVFFGSTQYLVDTSTIHQLHNPNSSLADLKIFKIIGDPGLPTILPSSIATAPPSLGEHVFMMGNGLSRGDQHFWTVDTGQAPWVWTESTHPADASGYDLIAPRTIRWGENDVDSTNLYTAGVWGYTTRFDDLTYSGTPALTHEAQASVGDSGGPAFYFVDGKWVLSGMMITVSPNLSGQPVSTTLLNFQTLFADLSYYRDEILEIAGVVGRHVFYHQSTFGISGSDDAIATDKVAYLPGDGASGAANATSYARGINGIMIDLATNHGSLTLDDFAFQIGTNNTPSTWAAAPTPTGFTVRAGAGAGNSDRVEITWPDGAITNTWLEVTVEGNDADGGFNTNTGLAASDAFYFGNKIGDTFSDAGAGFFTVNATDELEVRGNQGVALSVANPYDFNRDAFVNSSDQLIARNNQGFLIGIDISNPPAAPQPPPTAAIDEVDSSAVAFAVTRARQTGDSLPLAASWIPRATDEPRVPREKVFDQLALADDVEWLPAGEDEDFAFADEEAWSFDVTSELEGRGTDHRRPL